MEMDDGSELLVQRSWTAGAVSEPRPKDLTERLVVVRDGKRVSVQSKEIWQDFIRAAIPPGITQFFFFDGEKIQEIAADDHSEVRLKSSLEAALGIQYINRLAGDIVYIKQEERKGFVEISDEDLKFKQSELKKERSKLTRKRKEREDLQAELAGFKDQLDEAKKRFEAAFHTEPESRDAMREQEKQRILAANRLAQVEAEARALCEKALPFSLAGKLFDGIRRRIEAERESASDQAIRDNAAALAKRIVRGEALRRFFHAAPAVSEVVTLRMLERLEEATEGGEPRWDPILVDLDATGHALMFLSLPEVFADLATKGPLARLLKGFTALLSDRERTALNLVTLPDELPAQETRELHAALREKDLVPLGRLFINRLPEAPVSQGTQARYGALEEAGWDAEVALARRLEADHERAIDIAHRLERELELPTLRLPALEPFALSALADELEGAS